MPIYEYQCNNCGKHFEIKQSFSDNPLTVCPNCAGKIHRVMQPAGIVFKGSGFYVTDSRGKQNLTTSGEKKTEAAGKESANGDSAEATPKTEAAASAAKPAESAPSTSSTSGSSNGSAADKS